MRVRVGRSRANGGAARVVLSSWHADGSTSRGFRFFFFSNERQEPAHIHVEQAERYAKFWLAPVRLADNVGFRSAELAELRRLVEAH